MTQPPAYAGRKMRLSYPRPHTGSLAGWGLEPSAGRKVSFAPGQFRSCWGRAQNPQLLGEEDESCLFPAVTLASASVGNGGDDITNSMWKSLASSTSLGCVLRLRGEKMDHSRGFQTMTGRGPSASTCPAEVLVHTGKLVRAAWGWSVLLL